MILFHLTTDMEHACMQRSDISKRNPLIVWLEDADFICSFYPRNNNIKRNNLHSFKTSKQHQKSYNPNLIAN